VDASDLPFDEWLMLDWSAASRPTVGVDSIWIARAVRGPSGRLVCRTLNPPTRHQAADALDRLLEAALAAGRRVLVGVDFSLGYPAGTARCLGLEPTWSAVWRLMAERVVDGPANANNRFEAAARLNVDQGVRLFWGRPQGGRWEHLVGLPPTDRVPEGLAPNPCATWRRTERHGPRGLKPGWQLFGGVTVGSQILTGLPHLEARRRRWGDQLAVWPFELPAGGWLDRTGPSIVVAEIWPSLFPLHPRAPVRDQAQVLGAVRACAELQLPDWERWLSPPSWSLLDRRGRTEVLTEEGWILGVR
jgi:precorrin-8X/cobalt-precorrin-8 methylmutase